MTALKSKQNHTVELLQTIKISFGHIVALGYLQPLRRYTPPSEENALSLAFQLIDAVVFMHTHSVAHLDIKPDNLLVDVNRSSHHLRVADFSLSVWVNGEDDTIEGYAGTPGWTAPEIGDENGPIQKYSPILADRWSCGKMLEYFGRLGPGFKEPSLERLSQALLNNDPAKRPRLPDPQEHSTKKRPLATTTQILGKKRRLPQQVC